MDGVDCRRKLFAANEWIVSFNKTECARSLRANYIVQTSTPQRVCISMSIVDDQRVVFLLRDLNMRNEKHKHPREQERWGISAQKNKQTKTQNFQQIPQPPFICAFYFVVNIAQQEKSSTVMTQRIFRNTVASMKISTRFFDAVNKSTTIAEISGHDSLFLTRFHRKWLIDELFPRFAHVLFSWNPEWDCMYNMQFCSLYTYVFMSASEITSWLISIYSPNCLILVGTK